MSANRPSAPAGQGESLSAPPFDIIPFLATPCLTASVATVGRRGGPALGSLWYLFEERRFWFTTRNARSAFLDAARAGSDVAVMVETFEPPDAIRLVRATGPARIEQRDPGLVQRIYRRYLTDDVGAWPATFRERLTDDAFVLWSVLARRGLAAAFPRFRPAEFRWWQPGPFLDPAPEGRP